MRTTMSPVRVSALIALAAVIVDDCFTLRDSITTNAAQGMLPVIIGALIATPNEPI